MSLLLRAVTGSCTEKRKVIFFMNINEQTVSVTLSYETKILYYPFLSAAILHDGSVHIRPLQVVSRFLVHRPHQFQQNPLFGHYSLLRMRKWLPRNTQYR